MLISFSPVITSMASFHGLQNRINEFYTVLTRRKLQAAHDESTMRGICLFHLYPWVSTVSTLSRRVCGSGFPPIMLNINTCYWIRKDWKISMISKLGPTTIFKTTFIVVFCSFRGKILEINGYRARIFKRLWSPGIDSKEWIPPAYVAWLAGTITLFLLGS